MSSLATANDFANEMANFSFSLRSILANGYLRQNSLAIICECDGLVHSGLQTQKSLEKFEFQIEASYKKQHKTSPTMFKPLSGVYQILIGGGQS